MVLALSIAWRPTPRLVWNGSESAPVGLYVVHPVGKPMLNDLVIVIPPEPLATFLAGHSYLPRGVPMLKQVRALVGQTVCRIAYEITIDAIGTGGHSHEIIVAVRFPIGRAVMFLQIIRYS
jgi:type IV secretory pathway protease TraF